MCRLCLFLQYQLAVAPHFRCRIFLFEVCTKNRWVLYMHYGSFMGWNSSFLSASRNTLMLHAFKFHELHFPHTVCSCVLCDSYNKEPAIGRCGGDAVVFSLTWKLRVPARSRSSEKRSLFSSCSHVSVCPRDSTRLAVDGFPPNLILETYVRAYLEYSNLVKIWKKK